MKRLLLAAVLAAVLPCLASVQGYPAKAITMVVPFAAGGPTDTIARIFAASLQQRLGQTVVIENTTGAAGTIGVAVSARLRGIEPLEHSTGHDFGLLLKAARGDRSVVEKWITTTQHQQMPPLPRDDAVAELARRLRSTRS